MKQRHPSQTIRRNGQRPYVPRSLARADDRAWRQRANRRIAHDIRSVDRYLKQAGAQGIDA